MKNPFDILLPYQRKIFDSTAKNIICMQSRQSGKSLTLSAKATWHCITHPQSTVVIVSVGLRSAYELLKKCQSWTKAVGVWVNNTDLFDYKISSSQISFSNGSRILILPGGNSAALRGYSASIILDEFALFQKPDETWAAIAPVITSNMSSPDKFIAVLSTPTSKNNRFAKIWFDTTNTWEKHKVTIEEAVQQGLKADIPMLKSLINDDLIWNTEYMCEFSADSSDAFKDEYLQNLSQNYAYKQNLPVYLGADIARTGDLTVYCVIQKQGTRYNLVDSITLKDTPFNIQMDKLKSVFKKYNVVGAYIDATGIGRMFQEEATRNISARIKPYIYTQQSKLDLFETLRKELSLNNISINPDFEQYYVDDLKRVQRVVSPSGVISYSARHSSYGHADAVNALALALKAAYTTVSTALPITRPFISKF